MNSNPTTHEKPQITQIDPDSDFEISSPHSKTPAEERAECKSVLRKPVLDPGTGSGLGSDADTNDRRNWDLRSCTMIRVSRGMGI